MKYLAIYREDVTGIVLGVIETNSIIVLSRFVSNELTKNIKGTFYFVAGNKKVKGDAITIYKECGTGVLNIHTALKRNLI